LRLDRAAVVPFLQSAIVGHPAYRRLESHRLPTINTAISVPGQINQTITSWVVMAIVPRRLCGAAIARGRRSRRQPRRWSARSATKLSDPRSRRSLHKIGAGSQPDPLASLLWTAARRPPHPKPKRHRQRDPDQRDGHPIIDVHVVRSLRRYACAAIIKSAPNISHAAE
jgi:hypothetical protein